MARHDPHSFSSDRPINKIEEDLLNRSGFSNDLANALASWHGNDSLVIALNGDWGSGKSSIKNMAIAQFDKINLYKPRIIEFSPWEWAAQKKITTAFFDEVSKSVNRVDKSKEGKKLASTLKKYGQYLSTSELVSSGLAKALPTLFVFASISGISTYFIDNPNFKSLSALFIGGLILWAAFLKWGEKILSKLSINIEASAKENELSLNEIRQDLTLLLSKRSSPLIIVLDDIDRLTSKQLKMVLQLVKANSEFPNVVFLLLYQQDLVEGKLTDNSQSGKEYLEKIVQVPLNVPTIETSRIQKILFDRLDKILDQDKSAIDAFDSHYWGEVFYGSLHVYFNNLRDVYRFTSTFSFHFNLLKGTSSYEVNPVDLIAIECLRVFEPAVYKEIARSKNIFTKNGSNNVSDEKLNENFIKSTIDKASENKKENVKKLIIDLFPTVSWVFKNGEFSDGFRESWIKQMRICAPSNFDKYFRLCISQEELSNSDLKDMLNTTSDSETFKSFVLTLKEKGISRNALSQFSFFTDEIPLENAKPYIQGILDVGDCVENKFSGITSFSSYIHIVRLAILFLKRIEDIDERSEILLSCDLKSKGLSVVNYIIVSEDNSRTESDLDIIVSDIALEQLRDEFLSKLKSLAEQSPKELLNHLHLDQFLYHWEQWGDCSEVKEWLQEQIKSKDACIILLRTFISISTSQTLGDYTATINKRLNLDFLEKFISLEDISNSLENSRATNFDESSKEVRSLFKQAKAEKEIKANEQLL